MGLEIQGTNEAAVGVPFRVFVTLTAPLPRQARTISEDEALT